MCERDTNRIKDEKATTLRKSKRNTETQMGFKCKYTVAPPKITNNKMPIYPPLLKVLVKILKKEIYSL